MSTGTEAVAVETRPATGAVAVHPGAGPALAPNQPVAQRALSLQRVMPLLLPAALFVAALALYLPRIEVPPKYIYDEVYHAYTAEQYVVGNPDAYVWYTTPHQKGVAYAWDHPPLGKLLISLGIRAFGNNSFGWRVMSALFGAIGIVATYVLALTLTRRRAVAALTSGLLLMDGLYFVQSRTGMTDIFTAVFMLCGFIALYFYLVAPPDRIRWPLLATGLFMGLGVATKWNAGYPAAIVVLVGLWKIYRAWDAAQTRHNSRTRLSLQQQALWVPVALIAVPAAVYILSYIPFFLVGHSLGQWFELQQQMFYYHTHLTATHPYASRWWSWPLDVRPVWYSVTYTGNMVANTYAQANPLLYWGFLPAVALLMVRWWREKTRLLVFVVGFFGQWLPWMLVSRITFIYHFLPAVPFGCLAVAMAVEQGWQRGRWLRASAVGYCVVVVAAFVFFYPIYSSVLLSHHQLDMRMWFPSWR